MNLFKNKFSFAFALCLFGTSRVLAQTDSPVGVIAKVWGVSTARASGTEGSYFYVTGPAMETYPGAGDGSSNGSFYVDGSRNATSGSFATTIATTRFELNKTYSVLATGTFIAAPQTLHVVAPPGYVAEIDGVQRPSLLLNVVTHTYTVRILSAQAGAMRAGEASSLAGSNVQWQVGLGSLQNGTSAGALSILNSATAASWASLFTPAGLDYLPPSSEIQVYRDGSGNIQQVLANQAVVNVVTNTATQYDIFFYHPGQLSGTAFPYTFTGKPYVQYRVEQGGTATTLQITSYTRNLTGYNDTDATAPVVRTAVTTIQRAGTSPNFTWTLHDWNTSGQAQATERVLSSTGTVTPPTDSRAESLVVQVPGGAIATQASRTFNYYSWGEEMTAQTLGSGTGLTTNLVYNDNGVNPGSQGYLQSVVAPGGGWEAYDYWYASNASSFAGTVKYRYRPYNNLPAAVTQDPTQGEVTYFEYVNDAFSMPTRPSLVQTSVNNVVTAKTSTSYTTAAHPSSATLTVVTATSLQSSDALNSLTTVTKYFQEDAGVATPSEVFYRSQLYSVTSPDQAKVSYSYEHGTFDETSHAFTSTPTGTASRIAVITGSANSSAGTLLSTYGSFTIDGVYLVDGKSTLAVTIRDSRALVRRTENYAWSGGVWNLVGYADLLYDYAGQPTSSVASNGATSTASFAGDQKSSETDASGITVSYTYDAAGRVQTAAKSSGPATTIAYDAAGRNLSETVSASGFGETIYSSHAYDTAGRLSSELPVGMSPVNYSYNVAGRSRTTTFPADTSTRTEYFQLDGRPDHVDGTAVVPQYYAYSIETDGRRTTQVYSGASGSVRYQKGTTDWLGRTTHTERPGFSASSQASYAEDNTYEAGTGHLIKTARSGFAPTLYQYDALGRAIRSGLGIANGSSLVLASTDRITDADAVFENYSSAWWLKETTTAYPFVNSATAVTTSIKRTRLTGHPANRLDETQVTDAEGNTITRTVDINRATATATITTTRPSVANNQVETVVNGLSTSVTGHDGLTTTAQYDPLSRAWKSTDPRNNTFTTAYKYGTALVQSVTDATGNTLGAGTVSYDGMGRKQWTMDANSQYTRFSYNLRGQLTNQWGGGSYPVSYGYDATYGDRTSMSTYRGAPAGDSATWPSVGAADTTTWTYDTPSGLLWKKTDAGTPAQTTQFDYNVRGQTASRKWARMLTTTGMTTTPVTTTYVYDGNTGELLTQTYNDTAEAIPTPAVTYTYTRLGQTNTVADGTGSRTFNYDGTSPWRMNSEALDPGFYASRVISRNYDGASGTGGVYGPYTPGFFKGRYTGYDLGIAGNTTRDQHIGYTTSNLARFVGVNSRTTTGTARDYVYNYTSSSALVGGYTMNSFSVIRGYEAQRNLLTSINSQWNGSSYTRYDYTSNALGQRVTAKQSGSAFADYGQGLAYSGTYNVYNYNARGELQTTARYRGDNPTTAPAATDELPAMRFEYRYDSIGNRTTAGATGTTGDDNYTANALNQYTAKDNKTVKVLGTAGVGVNVAVAGAPATGKVDHAWGANLVPANSAGPVMANATVNAAVPGGGTGGQDLLRTDSSRTYFVPKLSQALTYDADGNLASDGVWTYTYNAENQLVRMNTLLNASFTGMDVRIDFKYDYQGRRVEKSVFDYNLSTQTLDQRYLYDGPNLIAQTDASSNLQRTFAWGLDLAGSRSATGGVGALLEIGDLVAGKTLSVTYDGNGNVAGLVNVVTGALEAAYEYDPSGNLLRMEGTYAKSNPIRFSTKWQDDETGLINYGVRYYSSALGRFINRDPIAEKGGLNLYGFGGNDGVNRFDILGMFDPSDTYIGNPTGRITTGPSIYLSFSLSKPGISLLGFSAEWSSHSISPPRLGGLELPGGGYTVLAYTTETDVISFSWGSRNGTALFGLGTATFKRNVGSNEFGYLDGDIFPKLTSFSFDPSIGSKTKVADITADGSSVGKVEAGGKAKLKNDILTIPLMGFGLGMPPVSLGGVKLNLNVDLSPYLAKPKDTNQPSADTLVLSTITVTAPRPTPDFFYDWMNQRAQQQLSTFNAVRGEMAAFLDGATNYKQQAAAASMSGDMRRLAAIMNAISSQEEFKKEGKKDKSDR